MKLTNKLKEEIEDYSDTVFYSSIINELEEDRPNIHISDLTIPCMRRAYLNKKYSIENNFKLIGEPKSSLKSMWIGKKLHETVWSKGHETELIWDNRLWGKVDEILFYKYKNKNIITIIDKKTISYTFKEPHEHYIKQVEYYTWMLYQLKPELFKNIDLILGELYYITLNKQDNIKYVWEIKDLDSIGKELEYRLDTLETALKYNIIPEGVRGWQCNYCKWNALCIKLDMELYKKKLGD